MARKLTPKQNAEEPASPLAEGRCNGLTKRELFAAMAMLGMLANTESMMSFKRASEATGENPDGMLALSATMFADALLHELAKEEG